jgi:Jacalin-like lectin domain
MMFGTPHPRGKEMEFTIDSDRGEVITGFKVRAHEWIDAIAVVTNRKESGWVGHLGGGGKVFMFVPPSGYEVIGVFGRHGRCCESFGVLYISSA